MEVHWFSSADEIAASDAARQDFDPQTFLAHGADAHVVATRGGKVLARCSIWWNQVPPHPEHRLGVIGHYSASDAGGSRAILEAACGRLREHGCTLAIGPMDGNTWRRYRLVSDFGVEPPFFLEPWNPREWPVYFVEAGFSELAEYTSLLNADLTKEDPRAAAAEERLLGNGVTFRTLDLARWEEELRAIYSVSVISFTANHLYTPVSESAFLAQYAPVKARVQPELVFMAEHGNKLAGYLFAIPDLLEAQRGEPVRTVIGKTLAVLPGKLYGGLGALLTDKLHRTSRSMGFTRVIHALQFSGNKVRNMSNRYGAVMRRYTLYSRLL